MHPHTLKSGKVLTPEATMALDLAGKTPDIATVAMFAGDLAGDLDFSATQQSRAQAAFDLLVDQGLVAKPATCDRTTPYALTKLGKAEYERMRCVVH